MNTISVVPSAELNNNTVPPHYALKAGDLDPELNLVIKEIVLCTEKFIVYLAEDDSIQWRTTDSHQAASHLGQVLNWVSSLEARAHFLKGTPQFLNIRRNIAEILARGLDDYPLEYPRSKYREVSKEIAARNKELSWSWYFSAAYGVTAVCAIALTALWLLRTPVRAAIGHDASDVVLAVFCGAIGALLSVTTRGDRLIMDANAGKALHRLEGLSRIGTGLGGALLVALAIKSGLVLGGIHFSGNPLALLLACCIAAGASERLVPSLIERVEKAVSDKRDTPATSSDGEQAE
ncbi:hypothetical protein [Burkholderia sp. BCC0405]|uniref:hypothetical protein n=1 Tax=Burkholderia sp. BCC0405 TaxID=2676298 RepID=UPI00158C96AA|nr:hypothetical protein [Burkholderia sp. BCC0405]